MRWQTVKQDQPLKKQIDITEYSHILIGFLIWLYREPSIIDTFVESYDFVGKVVVPFATSGGSDMGNSAANL